MTEAEAVRKIATLVRDAGGRALLVGGCVRDQLLRSSSASSSSRKDDRIPFSNSNSNLNSNPADLDVEVFGLDGERLKELLSAHFDLDLVGASFGIIKLKHLDVDVALPRRETKLGLGHKAFATECDPALSVRDAAARRDFTVNAMYRDPLTDELIDPWNGRDDLEKKILRHVSPHFAEDPLRVLRGMQFVARFSLEPAPETVAICRGMAPEGLPPERLFGEWEKLLTKGVAISKGLNFLRATGWTKYYPELDRLIGCEQDPKWHPEGDVWNHTLCCLDAFARERGIRNEELGIRNVGRADSHVGEGFHLRHGEAGMPRLREGDNSAIPNSSFVIRNSTEEDLIVGLAVLCHDFGKPLCTAYDPVAKRIRSRGHDEEGVAPTLSFLRRLTNEERILKEVPPLVRLHMRPFAMWHDKSSDGAIRRLAAQVVRIDRLLRVAAADDAGRPPFPCQPEHLEWLAAQAERLAIADAAPKPIVQGRDLIALGLKPGPKFGQLLSACYEAQLDGAFANLEDGVCYLKSHLL